MQVINSGETDPVRAQTQRTVLQKIDQTIEERIRFYASQPRDAISKRIHELDQEWDIERVLETHAASLALSGLVLGIVKSKKYLIVSGIVLSFLLMHAIQGWCPPVPVLRKLGVRTRSEIDREKYALKVLRGDFKDITPVPEEAKTSPAGDVISAIKN